MIKKVLLSFFIFCIFCTGTAFANEKDDMYKASKEFGLLQNKLLGKGNELENLTQENMQELEISRIKLKKAIEKCILVNCDSQTSIYQHKETSSNMYQEITAESEEYRKAKEKFLSNDGEQKAKTPEQQAAGEYVKARNNFTETQKIVDTAEENIKIAQKNIESLKQQKTQAGKNGQLDKKIQEQQQIIQSNQLLLDKNKPNLKNQGEVYQNAADRYQKAHREACAETGNCLDTKDFTLKVNSFTP